MTAEIRDHLQPSASMSAIPSSREERERRVHVYGDFSVTPATMPKDTAYIHSGLKVVKCPPIYNDIYICMYIYMQVNIYIYI